jgi:hypothetical protein
LSIYDEDPDTGAPRSYKAFENPGKFDFDADDLQVRESTPDEIAVAGQQYEPGWWKDETLEQALAPHEGDDDPCPCPCGLTKGDWRKAAIPLTPPS